MAADAWKKLIATSVADVLKPSGFRKSGLTFTAARSGVTFIVSLQSSIDSSPAELKITCNLRDLRRPISWTTPATSSGWGGHVAATYWILLAGARGITGGHAAAILKRGRLAERLRRYWRTERSLRWSS